MAKRTGDSESDLPQKCGRFEDLGPLTVWRRLLFRSGGSDCRQHDTHCALPKRKYVSNLDLDGTGVTRSFAASPLISSWFGQYYMQNEDTVVMLGVNYYDNNSK